MPITAAGQQAVKNGGMGLICWRVKMSKFLLLTVCAFGLLFSSALAQAQCTYRMNDKGRPHGYLSGPCNGAAVGYAGAYPHHPNAGTTAHPTVIAPKVVPQANSRSDGCVGQCPAKCQASWQALGFRSVEACYVKWGKLNRLGIARQCEAANRARLAGQPKLPGC
jgi:hypothetical protein